MMSSFEDPARVNTELAKLGDTIGSRIADDFLSKAEGVRCRSFREAMTVIAKVSLNCGMPSSACGLSILWGAWERGILWPVQRASPPAARRSSPLSMPRVPPKFGPCPTASMGPLNAECVSHVPGSGSGPRVFVHASTRSRRNSGHGVQRTRRGWPGA